MATGVTMISDLNIIPGLFGNGVNLESLALDALIQSGAVIHAPYLDQFLGNPMGGSTITIRHLLPLGVGDPVDISNDDPTDMATPSKVGTVETVAVRQSLNKSFSEMDLAVDLYGSDPISQLMGQLSKYWLSCRQERLLLSIQGLVADSVANHGSDLLHDISGEDYATLTESMIINPHAIIDAAALMGDRSNDLVGLAVHNTVFATMQKLNLIETEKLSDTNIFISRYMGMPVVRDDNLTVDTVPAVPASGEDPAKPGYKVYYSYLFGAGAFAFGLGSPKTPFEIDRIVLAGHGGGQDIIVSRQSMVLHPNGYKCKLTSTPTDAQLKSALSWERSWDRKRIPLAVIKSRG